MRLSCAIQSGTESNETALLAALAAGPVAAGWASARAGVCVWAAESGCFDADAPDSARLAADALMLMVSMRPTYELPSSSPPTLVSR